VAPDEAILVARDTTLHYL